LRTGNTDSEAYDIANHTMQTIASTGNCYDHSYSLQTENDYDTANVLSRKKHVQIRKTIHDYFQLKK